MILSKNGRLLKYIGLKKSFDLMHRKGTRLIKQVAHGETHWYVVPGGLVTEETAERIREHPLVYSGKDGLWPGMEQIWRMSD